MSFDMIAQILVNSAKCSDFLQVAVYWIVYTLYQLVIKSPFWRGNDLETVLLTSLCTILHTPDNLFTKVEKGFIMQKYLVDNFLL